MSDFTLSIRRALQRPCSYDFLAVHQCAPEPVTRPAFGRLFKLIGLSLSGHLPAVTKLADDFHTSTKTIYRDFNFLREQLGLALKYNRRTHTWVVQRELPLAFTPGGAK